MNIFVFLATLEKARGTRESELVASMQTVNLSGAVIPPKAPKATKTERTRGQGVVSEAREATRPSSETTVSAPRTPPPDKNNNPQLPIDAHRNTILRKIERDRVVLIQGETGTTHLRTHTLYE